MFWYFDLFFVSIIRCDLCSSCKPLVMTWNIKRNLNLYFCICVYLEMPFAGKFASFSHTWLGLFFWVIQYWQPYQKIHLLSENLRILRESNCILCKFSIENFTALSLYIAICLFLNWFCLCCSSSEFLNVQLVAVIVCAVCWLALYYFCYY